MLDGRSNEGDVSRFDVGKESVLLRFVEAMDFIDEHDRARAGACFALSASHDVLDFLDASEYRAERDKFRTRQPGDEARKCGLPATRRSPEQHRVEVVIFNLHSERFAG